LQKIFLEAGFEFYYEKRGEMQKIRLD
jgi:hypothetical protein